jgi:hypothetical protein
MTDSNCDINNYETDYCTKPTCNITLLIFMVSSVQTVAFWNATLCSPSGG